ncbi:hypothetical protein [Sphingomonas sp.]|uniref:hypothetical protein n=1 Tax=Sphingomonas sp. TaxID=28214 RepID=UPI003F700A50
MESGEVLPNLVIDDDGMATVRTRCAIPGAAARARHRCVPVEATRLIRAELAFQPADDNEPTVAS